MKMGPLFMGVFVVGCMSAPGIPGQSGASKPDQPAQFEYTLLATSRTSSMQKEMNRAAAVGYCFEGVMGGQTSFGGQETVVIMGRPRGGAQAGRFRYLLLATQKTSTMQKELQSAGDEGYEYRGQTVFETAFGGKEVVVILELDPEAPRRHFVYRLLATKKTSTMQKEISEASEQGFQFVGVTVGETSLGGNEVVVIVRRPTE